MEKKSVFNVGDKVVVVGPYAKNPDKSIIKWTELTRNRHIGRTYTISAIDGYDGEYYYRFSEDKTGKWFHESWIMRYDEYEDDSLFGLDINDIW